MSTPRHRRCRSITSLIQAQQSAAQNNGVGGLTVLSIMVTAHQVRWERVQQRAASHPEEAKQRDAHGVTVLVKALTRRIEDYPSAKVVEALIHAHPGAVWEGVVQFDGGRLRDRLPPRENPLIAAAQRRASLPLLQCLMASRPCVPTQDMAALVSLWNSHRSLYGNEQELIHQLMGNSREASSLLQKLYSLLNYCTGPENSLVPFGKGGSLHRASLVPKCSVNLFQAILRTFPEQTRQLNEQGRLPLHTLMILTASNNKLEAWEEQQSREQRRKILVQSYPDALRVRDRNGQLPLHLAIKNGWHHFHLMEMVEASPSSLKLRDGVSHLYPFQLAAVQDLSLTTIYKLLRQEPGLLEHRIPPARQNAPKVKELTNAGFDSIHAASRRMRKNDNAAVPDEIKALLQHVLARNDDQLWKELQSLLCHSPSTRNQVPLALHGAVSLRECPMGLIRVLLHRHPEQLQLPTQPSGRTPLHCAAANATRSLLATTTTTTTNNTNNSAADKSDLRTIRLLAVLEAHPLATQVRDAQGQLPLHLAVVHGMPTACLEALIAAWPDALEQPVSSLYPFALAACSPAANLNDVFLLLQRAPHVLSMQCQQ